MKRLFVIFLIVLLFVGCSKDDAPATDAAKESQADIGETFPQEPPQLPHGLEGEWMSASAGERGYTESIAFAADGTLTVSSLKDGIVQQTIHGTFYVDSDRILYEITEGAQPFEGEYTYVLDGRELYLIDDDGAAHYLRTS